MVLKLNKKRQEILVPLRLVELIPENDFCFLVENVLEQIDFEKYNSKFFKTPGQKAYDREILLGIVLKGAIDGGLSGREVGRRVQTDLSYMYLTGMEKPNFRTINRFKKDYPELIDEALETVVKIAEKEDLVRLQQISIDGTKIKAKASVNKIVTEDVIKILKKQFQKSLEKDNEENNLFGENGDIIPSNKLTNKESFEKIMKEIKEETKNSKNHEKLNAQSLKILKKGLEDKKYAQKFIDKSQQYLDEFEKTGQKSLSWNDPEAHWMPGKDGRMRFNYNPQIAVDSHSGIIISAGLSNNPTDHYELIPRINDIESKYGQLKPGTQIFADNGYSTDENTQYLKDKCLDGYIASRKLSRKAKKINKKDNPFSKDYFIFDLEKDGYICPQGQILNHKGIYKNGLKTVYWTNNCKYCPERINCCGKYRNRTITDYGNPAKIEMQRKMETEEAQEIYKIRSKTVEWPFGNIKRNMKIIEFNTTGLERTDTEFKLLAIAHNMKIIQNVRQNQITIKKQNT